MQSDVIEINEISTTLVEVTEEIEAVSLEEFSLTTLQHNGIELYSNSQIFYTFLNQSNHYQISTYQSSKIALTIMELLPYTQPHTMNEHGFELYLAGAFFAIFKDKALYYYCKIDHNTPILNLEKSLQSKFNIEFSATYNVSNEELNQLKALPLNKRSSSKLFYFKDEKTRFELFRYVSYFALIMLLLFYSFGEFSFSNEEKKKQLLQLKSKYEQLKNSQIKGQNRTYELALLLNQITSYHLLLKSIRYENNKISVVLQGQSKLKLYEFLGEYKAGVIHNLWQNGIYYEMEADFYF